MYAAGCIHALYQPTKYEFLIALVSPDGLWRFPQSLDGGTVAAAKPKALHIAVELLANARIDVAIPHMFCLAGMTQYRALLETLGIAFVGNLPFQMALTADKEKTKAVVSAAGVNVPRGELLVNSLGCQQPTLKLPVVVKPNHSDNSDDVSLVRQPDDYPAALDAAFACSPTVLI